MAASTPGSESKSAVGTASSGADATQRSSSSLPFSETPIASVAMPRALSEGEGATVSQR